MGFLLYLAFTYIKALSRLRARVTRRLAIFESHVGFQPKLKILISFYQIGATLGPVYGVRLHEDFTRWTEAFDAISLDLLSLTYPESCIGSMRERLLLGALWPIAFILLGCSALAFHALGVWLVSDRKLASVDDLRNDLSTMAIETREVRSSCVRTTLNMLYWAVFVAYLALPSASRSIFKAKQCESFLTNALTRERRSYLVADPDVLCSDDDENYGGLDVYFWGFFALWPVCVPLIFLALLLSIRKAVRVRRITPLARACRFLWRDYDADFLFWEVVDLGRKLFLASLVLFIDIEYGSSKLLRLVVASVVSAFFLGALALARPFKRADDLHLACIANLLLVCCFVFGIVIQLCSDDDRSSQCYDLVGLRGARGASELVVALTAAMLAVLLLVVLLKTISAVRAPTIRLASSGREPNLELPKRCTFHAFISHAWGTGQDQARRHAAGPRQLSKNRSPLRCRPSRRRTRSFDSCSYSCPASESGSTWTTWTMSASLKRLSRSRWSSSSSSPRGTSDLPTAGGSSTRPSLVGSPSSPFTRPTPPRCALPAHGRTHLAWTHSPCSSRDPPSSAGPPAHRVAPRSLSSRRSA